MRYWMCVVLVGTLATIAQAAYEDYVKLLGNNSGNSGESTFVTNIVKSKYGWSDGRDPHAGDRYYCGYQLCTPKVTSGQYTFAGDQLVMGSALRVLGNNQRITIGDLVLDNGSMIQTAGNPYSATFLGSVTVNSDNTSPVVLKCGRDGSCYVIDSVLKGMADACCRVALFENTLPSGQYVQFNDATLYGGTVEVCSNMQLRLYSDLPGRVVVENGATLAVGGDKTIGSLKLCSGATLDLSAAGMLAIEKVLELSGDVSLVTVFKTVKPCALIKVPADKGTLDVRTFSLIGSVGRLWVEVEDGIQTLYGEGMSFPRYDDTTGFVTRTGASGGDPFNDEWSDGCVPHLDTNYVSSVQLYVKTNGVFNGRSLTMDGAAIRMTAGRRLTVSDLRVDSGSRRDVAYFTTAGGNSSTYLSGSMTVLSRIEDEWPYAFFGSKDNGHTWISDQTIHGDAGSALVVRGHFDSSPGTVRNFVEFTGDLSDFLGTLIVQHNETVKLGTTYFPGTVRLETAYSQLATVSAPGTMAKVGVVDVCAETSIDVAAENELTVMALRGQGGVSKTGGGMLMMREVVGDDFEIRVQEGTVKALTRNAFKNSALRFAVGGGLAVDYLPDDEEMKSGGVDLRDVAIVVDDKLDILVQFKEESSGAFARFVPICTISDAQADALAGMVGKIQAIFDGGNRRGKLVRRSVGEGLCVLGTNISPKGMIIDIK